MLRAQFDTYWYRNRSKSSEAVVFYDGVHDNDSGSEKAQDAFLDYLTAIKATPANESSEEAADSSGVEEISSSSEDEEINTRAGEMVLAEVAKIEAAAYQSAVTAAETAEHASLAKFLLSEFQVTSVESNLNADNKDVEIIKLCLQRNQLIKLLPAFTRQIRALAYEAGLLEMKNSAGFDPDMNSFFRHDEKLSEKKLPVEIAVFAQSLREFTSKYSVDVKANNRQTF